MQKEVVAALAVTERLVMLPLSLNLVSQEQPPMLVVPEVARVLVRVVRVDTRKIEMTIMKAMQGHLLLQILEAVAVVEEVDLVVVLLVNQPGVLVVLVLSLLENIKINILKLLPNKGGVSFILYYVLLLFHYHQYLYY